ncbi:hypothetical protein S83_055498, partial [Arachis hypogaea]
SCGNQPKNWERKRSPPSFRKLTLSLSLSLSLSLNPSFPLSLDPFLPFAAAAPAQVSHCRLSLSWKPANSPSLHHTVLSLSPSNNTPPPPPSRTAAVAPPSIAVRIRGKRIRGK